MRYTVPWLPVPREPRDGDELSGTAIMLALLAGGLVARRRRPVEGDVLASALVALFSSAHPFPDDDLVALVSSSILLARAFGLIELTEDGKRWRATSHPPRDAAAP